MDLDQLESAAVQRLEAERTAKIAALKTVAEAAVRVADLRAHMVSAEAAHTAAYREVLKHGWTDADLKHFGIDQPGKKPTGRPRRPSGSTNPVSAVSVGAGNENGYQG
ncbi:hypothetical protein ACFUOZ_20740 [Paenarthrobacter sp. NPDC057355]|uniref:hypothetical protein n=1 Tax=Paenarthrobacter sp. NPDC057355 TaxID=3346105 RepID=UPI0036305D16